MKITDLGSYYEDQLKRVLELSRADSLWQEEALAVSFDATKDFKDLDELFDTLHWMQRLDQIITADLENHQEFRTAFDRATVIPTWNDFLAPPADLELQHSLAQKLYNVDPSQKDEMAEITLCDGSRRIGPWLFNKCREDNIPFILKFGDGNFTSLLLNHSEDHAVKALADQIVTSRQAVTKSISVLQGQADETIPTQAKKQQDFIKHLFPYSSRRTDGSLFYTLTMIPTPKDADIDGMDYNDYTKLFFEMCDQPWHEVDKAHKQLIQEFNTASNIRITNNDGTDILMSLIDEDGSHFTFCNSLIAKNVPGSEIFSAFRKNSLHGKIVSKGKFSYGGQIFEDLTMVFKDGKLVDYDVRKGMDVFEKMISTDDGALFGGEIGIGTNPHLQQHVANVLLVEKIGGSFHIALGRSYSYTEYGGVPVKVDNGNESAIHQDITTMLRGKGGKIYLDGRLVMDNGLWCDTSKYDVLNRGWEAVPEDQRPDYWKDYYRNKNNGPS